jgi:hypothetical protein
MTMLRVMRVSMYWHFRKDGQSLMKRLIIVDRKGYTVYLVILGCVGEIIEKFHF